MNIYLVNRYSKLKGPFDIIDSNHQCIMKVGDICLRDTIKGVAFYVVYNLTNAWNACNLVGIGRNDVLSEIGNTLLFSFDGLSKRKGNITLIKQIAPCFKEKVIDDFFRNAVDILEYKKDLWDGSLFPQFFASFQELIERDELKRQGIKNDTNRYPSVFAKYLSKDLLDLLTTSLNEGKELKDAYLTLREKHPVMFRKALKQFVIENPNSTIYDKSTNAIVHAEQEIENATEVHDFEQEEKYREVIVDDLQSYTLNDFDGKEFNLLLNRYRKGDKRALGQIIKGNQKLVAIIADSYRGHGIEFDDLVQEGSIGLMRAIDRFNPKRNVQFPAYAKWWIRQSMEQALITLQSMVKIPYRQVALHKKVRKSIEFFEQVHGYKPSPSEIAIGENADPETIAYLSGLPDNLHQLTTGSVDLESYPSEDFAVDETLMKESRTFYINSILMKLKPRDATILRKVYGIGEKKESLGEIGEKMGLTRERVRQISEKAVCDLSMLLSKRHSESGEENCSKETVLDNKKPSESKKPKKKVKLQKKNKNIELNLFHSNNNRPENGLIVNGLQNGDHIQEKPTKVVKEEKRDTRIKGQVEIGEIIIYASKKGVVVGKNEASNRIIIQYEDGTIDNVMDNKEKYRLIKKKKSNADFV